MSIETDVSAQMTAAMRARDKPRLSALRGIRAAFQVKTKADGSDSVSDADAIAVLRRLAKQRNESIEAFAGAGRPDRADAERAELRVIEEFLPALADEAQTRTWVEEAIAASGATEARDVGRVMGAVMKAHKGDVDGGLARRLAVELLTPQD